MCFFTQQTKTAQELEHRFKAAFKLPYKPGRYNGFEFPQTPVITNKQRDEIQLLHWGLIPGWSQDESIRKFTLNARLDSLQEKASFRGVVNNRCLILADGFFEWQWLDPKGKQKQQYLLTLPNNESFGFAGLWSTWTDKQTGEIRNTYAIITTEANALMSEIHNTKKRMPVIIHKDYEEQWLQGGEMVMGNEEIQAERQ